MAAITSATILNARYSGGVRPREEVEKTVMVNGTADDTISAAVLGFNTILSVHSGAKGDGPTPIGINRTDNVVVIGAGPDGDDVTFVVTGTPALAR